MVKYLAPGILALSSFALYCCADSPAQAEAKRRGVSVLTQPEAASTRPTGDQSFDIGNVTVTVSPPKISAVGVVRIEGPWQNDNRQFLSFVITLRNNSANKKALYRTFRGTPFWGHDDFADIHDDNHSRLRRIDFGLGDRIYDSVNDASIHPGETIMDVIVFEKPVEGAKTVTISFPFDNLGGDGYKTMTFNLPPIQTTASPQATAPKSVPSTTSQPSTSVPEITTFTDPTLLFQSFQTTAPASGPSTTSQPAATQVMTTTFSADDFINPPTTEPASTVPTPPASTLPTTAPMPTPTTNP